jgi:ABC-type nitrate/sulfonate/bicarbonate transport system substrate-binding protein
MAEDKGYYAGENLDVDLLAGGFGAEGQFIDPLQKVVSGEAEFGIVESTLLLPAREAGMPVVAIANIYQRHPLALTSLAEKNIVRPQDLVGKTVQLSQNSTVLFQALLSAEGIDPASINVVERTDFTINPLINGEADVIDGWVINEIVPLTQGGYEFNMILPSDYGIDLSPAVIFTTEDMIANHPDLVKRFLRATLQGIQSAADDPARAAALSVEYKTADNVPVEASEEAIAMQQSLPLLLPAGTRPGLMQPELWDFTDQVLVDQGILERPLDIEAAFTTKFLDEIYGEG